MYYLITSALEKLIDALADCIYKVVCYNLYLFKPKIAIKIRH